MKILFLSTATGQGHNSAASAVKEYFEENGCETVLGDILNCGNTKASGTVSNIYSNITIHIPKFFGFVYHLGELISSPKVKSVIYLINGFKAKALLEIINKENPDAIVCPHLFAGETVTKLRRKYKIMIPAFFISTDYTCSPFDEETELDYYIIPHKDLFDEFSGKGIPYEKLVPFGIPVAEKFRTKLDKTAARDEFGLTAEHVYTVMGGSMGFGNLDVLAKELLARDKDSQIAVVCGHNKKAFDKLSGIKNVVPFEYTDKVNVLMDAADVLLTKPGGLSSSEAINKNVPIVFTPPIPGCETMNSIFFKKHGVAYTAKNSSEAADMALELVNNKEKAQKMLKAQREFQVCDARNEIGKYILDHLRG